MAGAPASSGSDQSYRGSKPVHRFKKFTQGVTDRPFRALQLPITFKCFWHNFKVTVFSVKLAPNLTGRLLSSQDKGWFALELPRVGKLLPVIGLGSDILSDLIGICCLLICVKFSLAAITVMPDKGFSNVFRK